MRVWPCTHAHPSSFSAFFCYENLSCSLDSHSKVFLRHKVKKMAKLQFCRTFLHGQAQVRPLLVQEFCKTPRKKNTWSWEICVLHDIGCQFLTHRVGAHSCEKPKFFTVIKAEHELGHKWAWSCTYVQPKMNSVTYSCAIEHELHRTLMHNWAHAWLFLLQKFELQFEFPQ